MPRTVNASMLAHEPIFDYYVERQQEGRFDRYNPDMQTFVNHIWNRCDGVTVAMSLSGIGSDTTNGFVQFICSNPIAQMHLINKLSEIRDMYPRDNQPIVEIRSKSAPKIKNNEWYDDISRFITVMFRTPRFRNKGQAMLWWRTLADRVTQPIANAA